MRKNAFSPQTPAGEIHGIEQKKIIALTVNPRRLEVIRCQRQLNLKADAYFNYTDIEQIRREVLFAMRQFEQWRWPILDVTYKSIEETATEVMRLIYAQSGLKKGNIF